MSFNLYAEVEHAKYRDKLTNMIIARGFRLVRDIDDYSDDDLKDLFKLIIKHRRRS